jgi:RNA polymerase sigma-70 factor (ECF subfamily)
VTGFDALYREYAPHVFRFALYLCGDRSEAEDLTSETFVRAWAAPEPVRTATVKGYLLTITRNLHLQERRRTARHVALPEELREPRPGPDLVAERSSELGSALADLQRLPEGERAALLMRAVEELSYEEIARALGITLAATKVRIHRARIALARMREART